MLFKRTFIKTADFNWNSTAQHIITTALIICIMAFGGYYLFATPEDSLLIQLAVELDALRQFSFLDVFLGLMCLCYLIALGYFLAFECVRYLFKILNSRNNISVSYGITQRVLVSILLSAACASILCITFEMKDLVQVLLSSAIILNFGFFVGCYWEWKSLRPALVKIR
jgi:hypothetical protein